MKKLIVMCGLFLSMASFVASAEVVNSTISNIRVHTVHHPDTNVRQFVTIQLTEQLGGGCEWLFLNPKDEYAFNQVLTARTSGHDVTVHYDFTHKAPWHANNTCAITAIDL